MEIASDIAYSLGFVLGAALILAVFDIISTITIRVLGIKSNSRVNRLKFYAIGIPVITAFGVISSNWIKYYEETHGITKHDRAPHRAIVQASSEKSRAAKAGWFSYNSYAECLREEQVKLLTRWISPLGAAEAIGAAKKICAKYGERELEEKLENEFGHLKMNSNSELLRRYKEVKLLEEEWGSRTSPDSHNNYWRLVSEEKYIEKMLDQRGKDSNIRFIQKGD